MRELILKKGLRRTRVMMYDDIEQLPIERYNRVNRLWMMSDSLGNSFDDIDTVHLQRLLLLIDDKGKLKTEIHNLRGLVYNIISEVHPEQLAFAALVHSINGKERSDLTEQGLKATLSLLEGLTVGEVKKKSIRKEIQRQLTIHFPEFFKSGIVTAYWQIYKSRIQKELEGLLGVNVSDDISDLDTQMAELIEPKMLIGEDSYALKVERDFQLNCIALRGYTNKPVKELTTFEYFTLLAYHQRPKK